MFVLRTQDAEDCIPLPRLADYGLDTAVDAVHGAITEERVSCLFVRRILDERRRASSCFAKIAFPFPPPPAPKVTSDAAVQQSLLALRERLGDLEKYAAPRKTDSAQWDVNTAGAIEGTQALLDALGENNPILQGLLNTALDEIQTAGQSGRRLLQRLEYNTRMTDVLITHELMTFYGKGGIPGVTVGSCQVNCAFEHARPLWCTRTHTHAHTRAFSLRRRSARRPSRTRAPSRPTSAVRLCNLNPDDTFTFTHLLARRCLRLQARRAL